MDPSLAGEGFPFDYMQNSIIAANKPIFISHYSKDREWAYIFSSFTSGWIKTGEFDLILVSDRGDFDHWKRVTERLKRTEDRMKTTNQEVCENRFEEKSVEFHQMVRLGYLQIAEHNSNRFHIVDGTEDPYEVHREIRSAVIKKMAG